MQTPKGTLRAPGEPFGPSGAPLPTPAFGRALPAPDREISRIPATATRYDRVVSADERSRAEVVKVSL
jgi:hypothetical protein